MLEGKDCGWDKDRHLFRVAYSLEGSAYGNLGLAKADITTDKSVHRA